MARIDVNGLFDFRFNVLPSFVSTPVTFATSAVSSTNLESLTINYTDASRQNVSSFTIRELSNNATVTVSGLNLDHSLVENYLISGRYQSLLRVADAGNDTVAAGSASVNLVGGAGNDYLVMGSNGRADGGTGLNTLEIQRGFVTNIVQTGDAAFTITSSSGGSIVNTVQATDIQRIKIGQSVTAFDIDGNAGQVFRLYQAALGRTPDQVGLSVQVNAVDHGLSLNGLANNFLGSSEFALKYGANPSNEAFVTSLYFNVLRRAPDAGGFAAYTNALNAGALDKATALVQFSESQENHINVDPVIAVGVQLDATYLQLV